MFIASNVCLKKSKRFIEAIILPFGSRPKNLSGHIRSGPQPSPPLLCLNGHMKNNVSFFLHIKVYIFETDDFVVKNIWL